MDKAAFTCREACLDVLLKARSFFIWGLVKRWGWTGSPWSGVSEWLHSSCSRTGAFTEEFVRRLSSGIWQELKEAFCHSRVNLYPAASCSDSVGSSRDHMTVMAHLCIVELLLKDLNVEAVFPPGVQHQRLSHLLCGPIDLKLNKHVFEQLFTLEMLNGSLWKCGGLHPRSVSTACGRAGLLCWRCPLRFPASGLRVCLLLESPAAVAETERAVMPFAVVNTGTSRCDINTELKLSSYLHLQWPVHFFLRSQSVFEGCRCPRGCNRDSFAERRSPGSNKMTEKKISCVLTLTIYITSSVGMQGALGSFFSSFLPIVLFLVLGCGVFVEGRVDETPLATDRGRGEGRGVQAEGFSPWYVANLRRSHVSYMIKFNSKRNQTRRSKQWIKMV